MWKPVSIGIAAAGAALAVFMFTTGAATPAICPTPPPSPSPSVVLPDGPPVSIVGDLLLNDTGAQLYQAWKSDPVNTWCTGGKATVVDAMAELTGPSCVDLGSPQAYKAGIFQATISTSSLAGHPAFWMSGFSNVQGPGAWTNYGEIDAAEAPSSGCWEIFYHAHGAQNAYASGCLERLPGTYTVTIVRAVDGTAQVYYNGHLEATFPTDMANGQPTPLYIMFDTSGTTTPLTVSNLSIWSLA